jgi:predicted GNAT family acetyltransferase
MTASPEPTPSAAGPRLERRTGRYELLDGDELLSYADCSESDGVVTIPYIETIPRHRRQGYSSLLMAGVVKDLRERNLRAHATCPVARAYIAALPDADELLVN